MVSSKASAPGTPKRKKARAVTASPRRRSVAWSTIISIAGKRITWLWVGLTAFVAALVTLIANFETLHAKGSAYWERYEYLNSRKHPFPARLQAADIAAWNSGRLKLALYQIDGYLGKLRNSPSWLVQCLTNEMVFPPPYASQYNARFELSESATDQHNKRLIQKRIDQIEIDKLEDREILRINDPFMKLLIRSSKQLLSAYQDSEIKALDKPHLYLLRNSIYGQHGFKFDTAKLAKYAHRMGWSSSAANTYKASDVTPLERCNAFYLEQLHPGRELGALGRGILVRTPHSATFPALLQSSLCTCLARLKDYVDCRKGPSGTDRFEFHELVDMIVEFAEGEENKAEWTFLNETEVERTDADFFRPHQDKFSSSALDFNVAVQSALIARNVSFAAADEHKLGGHWGVKLTFARSTLNMLRTDPIFARELVAKMCTVVRDSLELAGPYIPRTVDTVPARLQVDNEVLEIFSKPIVFNDLRIKLTKEYSSLHYGSVPSEIEFTPRMIVVHRTATSDLKESLESMQPASRLVGAEGTGAPRQEVNISTHYLIDRDGTVYSLMKESYIARHVVGLDRHAIGIQNVGKDEDSLTDAQVLSNAKLVRALSRKHATIHWLVSNSESFAFAGSSLWEEKQPYRKIDSSPGAAFMVKLRKLVADLGLKDTP